MLIPLRDIIKSLVLIVFVLVLLVAGTSVAVVDWIGGALPDAVGSVHEAVDGAAPAVDALAEQAFDLLEEAEPAVDAFAEQAFAVLEDAEPAVEELLNSVENAIAGFGDLVRGR